jgi:energy-coupling factor transporter transmembrane protein EcfT
MKKIKKLNKKILIALLLIVAVILTNPLTAQYILWAFITVFEYGMSVSHWVALVASVYLTIYFVTEMRK